MLIDETNKEQLNTESELNAAIDNTLAVLPVSLDQEESKILNQIMVAPTQQELQAQFDLFNLTQGKKNALRIIKLNKLLDKVEDQAIERFEKRPDQVSNKEILEYMQVVSNQIERSQKQIDDLKEKPMILVKNEKTEVNINTQELDRDAKNRVLNAVAALMRQIENPPVVADEVIDVSSSENKVITEDEENIVYNDESEE